MNLRDSLLLSLIILVAAPIVFGILCLIKKLEGRKLIQSDAIRTRPSRILSAFFLGFAFLFFCGAIAVTFYLYETDENITPVQMIVIAVCAAAFSLIGFLGDAIIRFNNVAADSKGVTVFRLFKKAEFYRYDQISYFHHSVSTGILTGGLVGYGENGKKIFFVETINVSVADIVDLLRTHNVAERFNNTLWLFCLINVLGNT